LKILFVDQNFDSLNIGGAFKSNYAIIKEFTKNPNLEIRVLARKTNILKKKQLSSKQITPILKTPSKRINSMIKFFQINQYFSFFPIFKEIKKFKPNVIIVQRDLTFSTLLVGFLKKIPIVNIIRDPMNLCPKFIDITDGFSNCSEFLIRKNCWNCINRWRTLRVILLDKPRGFDHSLHSHVLTVYYKFLYFLTKFHSYLMKYAFVNIVASPLMKELIEKKANKSRVVIKKVTPIDNSEILISNKLIDKKIIDTIENSDKIILFVIPRNEGGSKGYPFVRLLLKKLPKDNILIIVGTILEGLNKYNNVVNIDQVSTSNLYYLYQKAKVTIVPSIYTEAFGRVILESIMNKTPVISSPQCGANYIFQNKNYVKVLTLEPNLWLTEIKKLIDNPIIIPDKDIKRLVNEFSPQECAKELLDLIEKIKY